MNKKGQLAIAKFIIILFVFLVFLALSPMLNSGINSSQENLNCSTDYSAICFITDAALPVIALVLLVMMIGYLKRS